MSKSENDRLVSEAYEFLERGRASDGLELLWSRYPGSSLREEPNVYLAHARLVGATGDQAEALRAVEDMRTDRTLDDEWVHRAGIWAAIYWSRLEEHARARSLLEEHESPDSDPESFVHYWGHLLTIGAETKDVQLSRLALQRFADSDPHVRESEPDRAELDLWRSLIAPACNPVVERHEVKSVEHHVSGHKALKYKPVVGTYVHNWLARLWSRVGDTRAALTEYEKARDLALSVNNGLAYLRSTLELIGVYRSADSEVSTSDKKKLITQAVVVAGQTGISLMPCMLAGKVWALLADLPDKDKKKHRSWLFAERYRPDIGRLNGKCFEIWCATFLDDHGSELFGLNPQTLIVDPKPEGTKSIDITLEHQHGLVRAGVQCKGGSRDWTERGIEHEMERTGSGLIQRLLELKQQGFTHYVFICAGRMRNSGKRLLDTACNYVFNKKAEILDKTKLDRYLLSNIKLRVRVCEAVVESS